MKSILKDLIWFPLQTNIHKNLYKTSARIEILMTPSIKVKHFKEMKLYRIGFLVRWSPQWTLVPSFFISLSSPLFSNYCNFMWFIKLRASAGISGYDGPLNKTFDFLFLPKNVHRTNVKRPPNQRHLAIKMPKWLGKT